MRQIIPSERPPPLPADAQTTLRAYMLRPRRRSPPGSDAPAPTPTPASAGADTWREGYYVWLSRSYPASAAHLEGMAQPLPPWRPLANLPPPPLHAPPSLPPSMLLALPQDVGSPGEHVRRALGPVLRLVARTQASVEKGEPQAFVLRMRGGVGGGTVVRLAGGAWRVLEKAVWGDEEGGDGDGGSV